MANTNESAPPAGGVGYGRTLGMYHFPTGITTITALKTQKTRAKRVLAASETKVSRLFP
jgi:hypothetical protein